MYNSISKIVIILLILEMQKFGGMDGVFLEFVAYTAKRISIKLA